MKIIELPIRKWTKDYKKFIETTYLDENIIVDFQEHHKTNQVDFELFYENDSKYFESDEAIIKHFKLQCSLSDNNYVLFDSNNTLKRYADETEILEEFYVVRENMYEKRKDYLLRKLQRDLLILENKVRFIKMNIAEEINVKNRKKKELLLELYELKFDRWAKIQAMVPEESKMVGERDLKESEENADPAVHDDTTEDDDSSHVTAKDYDYLMSMAIWSLTQERIQSLENEKAKKEDEIKQLKKVEIHDLWIQDLDAVVDELNKINKKEVELMNKKPTGNKDKDKDKKKKKARKVDIKIDLDSLKPNKRPPPPPKKTQNITKLKKGKKTKVDIATTESVASDPFKLPDNFEELDVVTRMKLLRKQEQLKNQETSVNLSSMSDVNMEDDQEEIIQTKIQTRKKSKPIFSPNYFIDYNKIIDYSSDENESSGSEFAI